MKMKTKFILRIAFAIAMNSVVADDTVYYLIHNEGNAANTGGFTSSALWKSDSGEYAGENAEALSPDKVFVARESKRTIAQVNAPTSAM